MDFELYAIDFVSSFDGLILTATSILTLLAII